MENCPCKTLKKFKPEPERIFVSYSSKDKVIIDKIEKILKEKGLIPYIAERNSIGKPLTDKLRKEMADSNMVLVVWTKNAKKSSESSEIIAFETGMAWLNQLPIFILKEKNIDMAWFYPQLTDYVEFENTKDNNLKQNMDTFDFDQYKNPICFCFTKENTSKQNSMNEEIVQDDSSICLSHSFNGIIHFVVGNHTNKIIRDIRVNVQFPGYLGIYFNPGGQGDGVQRNEMFDMKEIAPGQVRLMMLAMPSDEHWSFEVRVCVPPDKPSKNEDVITVTIQGGEYTKKKISIPLKI